MHADPIALQRIAFEYPAPMQPAQIEDIDRVEFLLSLIPPGAKVCDIGGGTGMFSAACMAAGAKSVLVIDDFRDPLNHEFGDSVFGAHRRLGVEFVSRDVVTDGIGDYRDEFDVIACICSIEHWHASPKRALHQMMTALKPGGMLIIGLPNCVNLRKRISWVLGTGEWTTMESWYEQPTFRSHVREPRLANLHYMARDIGLADYRIIGRNWAGLRSPHAWRRIAAKTFDTLLRPWPGLCSDFYLIGHR